MRLIVESLKCYELAIKILNISNF